MKPLYLTLFLIITALGCAAQDTTKETIYSKVEIEAAYPGGPMAWSNYLKKNLRYPGRAEDNGIGIGCGLKYGPGRNQ
jgi:hypothetical protein